MMNRFSKFLGAAAVAAAGMFAMPNQASALTNIGGVIVDENDGFNIGVTSIFETVVQNVGDELRGVGVVTSITGSGGNILWSNGDNNKQLTFYFDQYFVASISPSVITFTGGRLTVYVDDLTTGTAFDATTIAGGIASATDGTEWLNLVGHAGNFPLSGPLVTLRAVEILGGDFTTPLFAGSGLGYLSVDTSGSGLANFFIDTDSMPGGSDILFVSNFDSITASGSEFPVAGSANIRFGVNETVIPEPVTAALGLMSLAGLAVATRRRR
jgi:hypothetical protein